MEIREQLNSKAYILLKNCKNSQRSPILLHDTLCDAHNHNIQVKSAFYDRHQTNNGPCQCPYHRMKRYKQKCIIQRHSNSKIKKQILDTYRQKLAKSHVSEKRSMVLPTLERRSCALTENGRIRMGTEKQSAVRMKRLKDKHKSLDNLNNEFQEILKKRFETIADEQKVKYLLNFIRIVTKENPNYLSRSIAHIQNSLLQVVKKIKYDDLKCLDSDNYEKVDKIKVIINGKGDKGLWFLQDVQQAIKDLDSFIWKRVKEDHLSKESHGGRKIKQSQKLTKIDHSNSNNQLLTQIKQNSYQQKDRLSNSSNIPGEQYKDTQSDNRKEQTSERISLREKKDPTNENYLDTYHYNGSKIMPNKIGNKLKRNISRLNRNQNKDEAFHQLMQISEDIQLQSQCQKQKEVESDFTSNSVSLKTSIKFIQTKNDKQNMVCNERKIQEKKKNLAFVEQSKVKKSKKDLGGVQKSKNQIKVTQKSIKELESQGSFQPKIKSKKQIRKKAERKGVFDGLDFSKFFQQNEALKVKSIFLDGMISSDAKLDKIYSILEKKLENQTLTDEGFEKFLQQFKGLLSAEQIKELQERKSKWRYKKMIEKLTKKMDDCLKQINDMEVIQQLEEREELNFMRNRKKKRSFIEIQMEKTNKRLDGTMVILEQQVEWQEESKEEEGNLSQIELEEMKMEQIKCKIHKHKSQRSKRRDADMEDSTKRYLIYEEQHKRILNFMREKHPKAFQNLKENMSPNVAE